MAKYETLIFGSPEPYAKYTERQAAYVVIVNDDGKVATVKGGEVQASAFLPGGGSLPGEAPEDTVAREVMEELARSVRLVRKLGQVTQYFYADFYDRHYQMLATFFAGEFMDETCADRISSEHELYWLPVTEAEKACFHACHAWAVRRAVAAIINRMDAKP